VATNETRLKCRTTISVKMAKRVEERGGAVSTTTRKNRNSKRKRGKMERAAQQKKGVRCMPTKVRGAQISKKVKKNS